MKYAVIRVLGHQYKVSEGDEILVDKTTDENLTPEVLLMVNDEVVQVGTPLVEKATLTVKILGQEKGEKIDGFKYKAKSRYRKNYGHRSQLTRLVVEKIAS